MIIKKLSINNLQLIKFAQVDFSQINIICGKNLDNLNAGGNGSGKTTLILRALLFCLYGFVEEGLTLKNLIRLDEKECIVKAEIQINNDILTIIRKIPSELQIFLGNNEIVANTATLKQQFINEHLGDINFFRQYRIGDSKGINVLDLGIISLRKTLMSFIESYFIEIRTRLLAQKSERERYSIEKRLYKHFLSIKRKGILGIGLNQLINTKKDLQNEINNSRKTISKVEGEISAMTRIIEYKNTEIKKAEKGICPILKIDCQKIGNQMSQADKNILSKEIEQMNNKIEQLKESIEGDKDYLLNLEEQFQIADNKIEKARQKLLRLESAFQFQNYKYTKTDILLYDEAIKVLDNFSAQYIKEWLSSLAIIMNHLLSKINISIEFSSDKDFLRVYDNNQLLKYDQLSTGQKSFLAVIFRFSILMHQNQTGLIILDDSLNNLDVFNFQNLIEILQTLPFQAILVYQNYKSDNPNIKLITIERKNNESRIYGQNI